MAHPDLRDLKQANAGKNYQEYALQALFHPFGPYLAWAAIRLGVTPLQVTYSHMVLAVFIIGLSITGGRKGLVAATALVFAWQLLDLTDGTMARALRSRSNYGGFADYASGMLLVSFLPLALGIGAFLAPDQSAPALLALFSFELADPSILVLTSGAGISVIALYMRLINRALFLRFGESATQGDDSGAGSTVGQSIAGIVIKNIETLGGLQGVALFVGAFTRTLDALLLLYFAFHCAMLMAFVAWVYRNYKDRTHYL